MKLLKRALGAFADVSSALELVVIIALGTTLFVALFVVLPLWVALELFRDSRPALAVAVAFVPVASLLVAIRDIARRRWSMLSTVVSAAWLVCVILVGIRLLLAS